MRSLSKGRDNKRSIKLGDITLEKEEVVVIDDSSNNIES